MSLCVLGGDKRQIYLANNLLNDYKNIYISCLSDDKIMNHKIKKISIDEISKDINYFILPIMVSTDGVRLYAPLVRESVFLKDLTDKFFKDQVIFIGKAPLDFILSLKSKGIKVFDYSSREEFLILNAVPTAEGAIEIAMKETESTIFNQTCLVLGYGRVAKVLVKLLKALGAHVTIAARKSGDMSWAEVYSCNFVYLKHLNKVIGSYNVIFNTIPYIVLSERYLVEVKSSALIIDVASVPGGVDFAAAEKLNLKVIWATALPGKVAPMSAAVIVQNTIKNILNEI